jgi:hypothetical protein
MAHLKSFTKLLIGLFTLLLLMLVACKPNTPVLVTYSDTSTQTTQQAAVPFVPPAYYQCAIVTPMALENAFYSNYSNYDAADSMYDNQIFVFKNLLVDTWMIKDVSKGLVWADLTQCQIVDTDLAKQLKSGDTVDIVGICLGRDPNHPGGLLFQDCYILRADSIQLPVSGAGTTFTAPY